MAVALVLLFHAGFGWMTGGYLGVSVFFTLSGYLITNLLLEESAREGRISLRRFYVRRAKRLLPASLSCIGLVLVARVAGLFERVDSLRGDAIAAVGQVFNWARLTGTTSYADLFADPLGSTLSPLEHYWSLAIEEQFYLVWPVALIGLVALARRRRSRPVRAVALVTVAFGIAAPVIALLFGDNAAYWATPARLAEILVGATLAAWLSERRSADAEAAMGAERRDRSGVVAALAMTSIVVLSIVVPSGRGPAYHGALPLFALISGTLIWSLQRPNRVRRLLSISPLVVIGRISYGLYLFHWPVFVALRQRGWRLDRWDGFGIAMSITVILTCLSYVLVEQPIRTARWSPVRTARFAAVALVAATIGIVVTPAARPFLDVDHDLLDAAAIAPVDSLAPLEALESLGPLPPAPNGGGASRPNTNGSPITPSTTEASVTPTPTPTPTTPTPTIPTTPTPTTPTALTPTTVTALSTTTTEPVFLASVPLPDQPPIRPVRILVVGDSTSLYLGQGLAAWSLDHPAYAQASVLWSQGCGFVVDATITSFEAREFVDRSATLIAEDLPRDIARLQPDVVVLMTTVNDVADHRWSDDEGSLTPTDTRFRRRLFAAYRSLQDRIVALGVPRIIWIVPPTPDAPLAGTDFNDPVRYGVQHEVIRGVASTDPASASVVDLDEWFRRTGAAADEAWRPDGVHMTVETATDLASWFLGPEIVSRVVGPR